MIREKGTTSSKILFVAQLIGFFCLLVIIGYVLVETKNLTVLSLMVMLVLALIIPAYSDIKRINSWRAYQLNVIAPVIGLYVSLLFWVNSIGIDFANLDTIFVTLGLGAISLIVSFAIHYYTRELSVIKGRIEKDKIVHNSGHIIATIVLGAFITFSLSEPVTLDVRNISLVMLILGLYTFSSSFPVNSAYRRYKLDLALDVEDAENKIKELKTNLVRTFSNKSDEIEFLEYLLERMRSSFISGDFERCLIDGMTIICDETVVKPKEYVNKILQEEKKEKFRKIRVALVHSMIFITNEEGEKTKEIMSKKKHLEIKSKLYSSCVELQKVVFEVVKSFFAEENEN